MQIIEAQKVITQLRKIFVNELVTVVLPFKNFKPSREEIVDYYYKNPEKPFCKTYIDPKLKLLLEKYSGLVNNEKTGHLV